MLHLLHAQEFNYTIRKRRMIAAVLVTDCGVICIRDIYWINVFIIKMAVFWVVAPCSLVEVYQRFRGTYASIISHLRTHRRDNLKFYCIITV
jgi:hypothetical protein